MAFGDSLTMGLWDQPDLGNGRRVGGYEPHLEFLFGAVGRSAQVYNWGVGGETTLQALQGGKDICEIIGEDGSGNPVEECEWIDSRTVDSALAAQGSADYMLILEGTNDYFAGISPQSTAVNLVIMAQKGEAYGMTPIIGTLPPDERGTDKDIYYTNSVITSVANQNGVKVVDLHGGLIDNWGSYVGPDNLHPTVYGYEAMARIWFGIFYNVHLSTGSATFLQENFAPLVTTVEGSAQANGDVLEMVFEYGTGISMENKVAATPDSGNAFGGLTVSAQIEGLELETLYYYRLISNLDGTTYTGETKTFTTPEPLLPITLPWLILLLGD